MAPKLDNSFWLILYNLFYVFLHIMDTTILWLKYSSIILTNYFMNDIWKQTSSVFMIMQMPSMVMQMVDLSYSVVSIIRKGNALFENSIWMTDFSLRGRRTSRNTMVFLEIPATFQLLFHHYNPNIEWATILIGNLDLLILKNVIRSELFWYFLDMTAIYVYTYPEN